MRKFVTYLFIVLLAACLAACDQVYERDSTVANTPPPGEQARVIYVIDGDTIKVESYGREFDVRYIGVDTPERDEPFYDEATAATRKMVDAKEIILVQDVSETDQYGRLLRYIYLPDGTFVNAELIRQGYGRMVTFPPDVAHAELFTDLQREARENQRGLWAQSEMQALPVGCNTCSKNSYDCKDFDSQVSAQDCYAACFELTGKDVHHLDGGGDGVVCESLP